MIKSNGCWEYSVYTKEGGKKKGKYVLVFLKKTVEMDTTEGYSGSVIYIHAIS